MDKDSLEDDDRCGRHIIATTEENLADVHLFIIYDNRSNATQIANADGLSRVQVENILHNKLRMSNVSTRWVLRLLAPGQKPVTSNPVCF